MKDLIWATRLVACVLWFTCGIMSGGLIGHLSAFASSLFFITGFIERFIPVDKIKD